MRYIVYITINTRNLKIYVGVHKVKDINLFDGYIGCGIYSKNQKLNNYVLHRAIGKYGYDSFKRITLAVFDNSNDAYALERNIVTESFINSKNTYNTALGGVCNAGVLNKKSVLQYSLSGKFIKKWDSITEAAEYFNCSAGTLRQALVAPFKQRSGFQWRYYLVEFPEYIGYYNTKLRVAQYDLSGNLIEVWSSCKVASKHLKKKNDSALNKYARLHKIYEGYQWRIIRNNENVPDYIEKYEDPNLILQLTIENSVIKEWDKQILYKTKEFKNVKDCLNGKSRTYKGFKWVYKRDYVTMNS